jgi:hypothetical protein
MGEDIIDSLRASPAEFRRVMDGLPTEALRWSDGGWSIAAVLAHLAINEVFMNQRFHHIIEQDEPTLVVFRTDQLVPMAGSPTSSADEMFQRWQAVRFQICDWLARLKAQDWQRTAYHPAQGRVTLQSQVEDHREHDGDHLAQARTVRGGWETRFQNKREREA